MKISTHLLFDRGSSQMSSVQTQLTQSQAQLAQGKQILNASDAPNQAATIQRLKSILNKQDSYKSSLETIKARTDDLLQASMKLGEAMYKAQQGAEGGAPGAGAQAHNDDVIDADFKEVSGDEKKKGA